MTKLTSVNSPDTAVPAESDLTEEALEKVIMEIFSMTEGRAEKIAIMPTWIWYPIDL